MRKYIAPVIIILILTGILAAIAVPNLLRAMNRGRQKRTMADLRTIATALEAFATDKNDYNVDSFRGPDTVKGTDTRMDFEALHRVRFSDLERALSPTYIRKMPRIDGWGHEFEIAIGDYDVKGRAQLYALRSPGSDGIVERGPYVYGPTEKFEDDVVLSLGNFIRYPEGVCSQ
jgi:type II secretory pathway pseudopilin PulG